MHYYYLFDDRAMRALRAAANMLARATRQRALYSARYACAALYASAGDASYALSALPLIYDAHVYATSPRYHHHEFSDHCYAIDAELMPRHAIIIRFR